MINPNIKKRKRDMSTIGAMKPVEERFYNDIKIPAKCSTRSMQSFFNDKEFMPPKLVTVEPISSCNLTCLMCPTYLTDKNKSMLEFNIFKKIVEEAKDFQEFFVFQGTGEPFLNPQLFDMIQYAKENGIKNISVSTNGTLLNDNNIEKILDIKTSPNFLQISIDGHNKELFEKYRRGASYEKVKNGLKKLFLMRKEKDFEDKIEISINTLLSNELDLELFLEEWGEYVDDITIGPMLDQASQKNDEADYKEAVQTVNKKEYISCPKPYEILTILANGKISHCQHDFHNIHIKGDMMKGDKLLKTWRNNEYNKLREKHINYQAEETSCNGCAHMYRIENEEALFTARMKIQDYFKIKEN
ncbi:MAG: radical SAM protein [Arcobacteraceae bacterium]|nr:radical SAM protein [Arcobacteraceae bacterium]